MAKQRALEFRQGQHAHHLPCAFSEQIMRHVTESTLQYLGPFGAMEERSLGVCQHEGVPLDRIRCRRRAYGELSRH